MWCPEFSPLSKLWPAYQSGSEEERDGALRLESFEEGLFRIGVNYVTGIRAGRSGVGKNWPWGSHYTPYPSSFSHPRGVTWWTAPFHHIIGLLWTLSFPETGDLLLPDISNSVCQQIFPELLLSALSLPIEAWPNDLTSLSCTFPILQNGIDNRPSHGCYED